MLFIVNTGFDVYRSFIAEGGSIQYLKKGRGQVSN